MKTKAEDESPPEVVQVPVEPTLDLHTYDPRELEPLLDDYLREAHAMGYETVRLIHGKGTGVLRSRVRLFLARHPLVRAAHDAPPALGSWGATVVHLASAQEAPRPKETADGKEGARGRGPLLHWKPLMIGLGIGMAVGAALLWLRR